MNLVNIFSGVAQMLHFINPIMMAFVSVMWMILYSKMNEELARVTRRVCALERQLDHIVIPQNIDHEFIQCAREMGEDCGR